MRISIIVLLVAALIATGLWYTTRERAVSVRVVTVARGEVRATVSNTRIGTVKACCRVRMSPSAAGQVSKLNVAEGDHVGVDAVLLEIWNQDRVGGEFTVKLPPESETIRRNGVAKCNGRAQ